MLGHIAKAITALVVVALSLWVGDETAVLKGITLLEGALISLVTAISVWAVPNAGTYRGGFRRVP
jgi:hypothetical protein